MQLGWKSGGKYEYWLRVHTWVEIGKLTNQIILSFIKRLSNLKWLNFWLKIAETNFSKQGIDIVTIQTEIFKSTEKNGTWKLVVALGKLRCFPLHFTVWTIIFAADTVKISVHTVIFLVPPWIYPTVTMNYPSAVFFVYSWPFQQLFQKFK